MVAYGKINTRLSPIVLAAMSGTDDSLGTDVGHLPAKPYIMHAIFKSLTLL